MKVYRVKHKPSGRYLDLGNWTLDKEGSVLTWIPSLDNLFILYMFRGVKEYLDIPKEVWELKEYELKD